MSSPVTHMSHGDIVSPPELLRSVGAYTERTARLICSTACSGNEKQVVKDTSSRKHRRRPREKEEGSSTAERLEDQPSSPHSQVLG